MKKTLKQIADELGISKDKVKYQARKLPTSCTLKDGGVTYLTEQGVAEIRRLLDADPEPDAPEPLQQADPMVEVLKATLDLLQKQLAEKDKQIAEKDALIQKIQDELAREHQHSREQADKMAVLADQAQHLQALGAQKQLVATKKKFLAGLFMKR